MAREKPPAFQCYAKDLYTGTTDLSPAEFGTYWRGICWSWDNGPLPLDDARRARILLTTPDEFARIWPVIAHLWKQFADGFRNVRLESVRAEQDQYREGKRRAGRASARARKQLRGNLNVNTTSTEPQQEAQRNTNPPSPSSSPSPISDLQSAIVPRTRDEHPPRWRPASEPIPQAHGLAARSPIHGVHEWCDYERELCVPLGLHGRFKARLGTADAHERLRAWYPTVVAKYAGQPVGDDLFAFWQNEFAAWVGTVTAKTTAVAGRGNASRDAMARTLARRAERKALP